MSGVKLFIRVDSFDILHAQLYVFSKHGEKMLRKKSWISDYVQIHGRLRIVEAEHAPHHVTQLSALLKLEGIKKRRIKR